MALSLKECVCGYLVKGSVGMLHEKLADTLNRTLLVVLDRGLLEDILMSYMTRSVMLLYIEICESSSSINIEGKSACKLLLHSNNHKTSLGC
jgi:hypothetical protein